VLDIDTVDPRFIDIDLAAEAQKLGIPMGDIGHRCFAEMAPSYEDTVDLIPESDWKELANLAASTNSGLSWLIIWILNQQNEGSCVGNAFTAGFQALFAEKFGKENAIQMSAISCYKQIGRSPGSGAMVDDGLEALRDVGILPLDTGANRQRFGNHVMPATGFYTKWPDDWKTTADNFRCNESHVVTTVPGLITALLKRHPVVVGRAGHSILYLDVIFKGNDLFVLYVNSWGKWGIGAGGHDYGFGLDSLRMVRSSASWAAALRTVAVPSFMSAA
jgi:hypothetical protein